MKDDGRQHKKRVRNPEATRTKLLQATIELVAAKGSDGLSLQDVARLAKVSRRIVYHHFKDPDQLLRQAMKWASHRLQEGVKRLNGASLHDRVMYSTNFVLDNPDICRLMIADALAGRDVSRRYPFIKLVTKMLRQLRARKLARPDLDEECVSYITFATLCAILMLRHQHKSVDKTALAERFTGEWIHILTSGIFADGVSIDALSLPVRPSRSSALKSAQ